EQNPGDGAQVLLDKHARACLAEFLQAQGGSRSVVSIARAPGATLIVAAFPSLPDRDVPDLTECDQSILALLAGKNLSFPAARIRDELEKRSLYVCSLDTVKRSLRNLKALRLVVASKK